MNKYILSIDQGTTSSRTLVIDRECRVQGEAHIPVNASYPKAGWVEQDPLHILATVRQSIDGALAAAATTGSAIAAIGITNQRETCIVWDRTTGQPIHNAIVWQDRRTAAYCERLRNEGKTEFVRAKTGLVIDPYFSATKLKWILHNTAGAREKALRGDLCFGTVDSWLVWNLTGGKSHVTDPSNASRTMLFNIHTLEWDAELLELFDIPAAILPTIIPTSGNSGVFAELYGHRIPITGIAGDQQAALFGQLCTERGTAKTTYGTGCFVMMNTGNEPVASTNRMLSTVAWQTDGKTTYALEGSVLVGGAAVQWLRDGLGIIDSSEETDALAASVPDNGGVYFVPALTGLGAPYWDPHARGTIVGITRGTTKGHIVRATLEAIVYQVNDVLDAMRDDTAEAIATMKVDGGAVKNDFLMQFQSDISGLEVARPEMLESSAMGTAFFAGLAASFWKDPDDIRLRIPGSTAFTPSMDTIHAEKLTGKWRQAVERSLSWVAEE